MIAIVTKGLALILLFTTVSLAGGNSGGGGTTVYTKDSKTLVFWDLFVNNPSYRESHFGDQIKTSVNKEIQKVDYSHFKSFRRLKNALKTIKKHYPQLYNIINENNFIEAPYELEIFASKKYLKNIEEVFFQKNFSVLEFKAYPMAHFDENTSFIYLNAQLWNQMGINSQAAFLLHERLRKLQLKYKKLTNELIQGIVFFVIDPHFSAMYEYQPNDEFFRFNESSLWEANSSENPLKRYKELLQENIFSDEITMVNNPHTVGSKNVINTNSSGVILSSENCSKLISGFEEVRNSFRSKLFCSQEGLLQGTGALYFSSPITSLQISIDIEARLSYPNDGGSEIQLNLFNDQDLAEKISTNVLYHYTLNTYTNLKLNSYEQKNNFYYEKESKEFNTFRFVLDSKTKSYRVYAITSKETILLYSASLRDELILSQTRLFWNFSINNHATVRSIKINQ